MNANKSTSHQSLRSDMTRVDAHTFLQDGYEELPRFTEKMLSLAKVNKGGRPLPPNLRKLIYLRLPAGVIEFRKAMGPSWQTRMAEWLSKVR